MLRQILVFMLAFSGGAVLANPQDDAELFMRHFIDQYYWDSAYQSNRRFSVEIYESALRERGVAILDRGRFTDLMPEIAADEAMERLEIRVSGLVIDGYGPHHLSEIAAFLRTPTGRKLLSIANEKDFFSHSLRERQGDPINEWGDYLSPLELARYKAFTSSAAGQIFVDQTQTLRRSLIPEILGIGNWPDPPLNRPYIVEIIKTDGVLSFPNPVARQSLIRELSAANP